ncbi:MAG TPA: TIR domain-containing protein [Thermoanaerobaculia bacterium]|nr:TIR domain-containing protein [Thermoanaerobaculia bacterium]
MPPFPPGPPVAPSILEIGRLPVPGLHFVGRDAELARLDQAWADPGIHVLSLVAFGGVGKSALVSRWLDRMAGDGWRGAERVLDWSFFSQGTEGKTASAEPFIDYALRTFGDPDPTAGSPHDRGARLAGLVRQKRTLLILDGVEPLQYGPGQLEGRLKDPGLTGLLKSLAAANPGLCLVTTREPIADLNGFPHTAPRLDLEKLSAEAAVELLRLLKVTGKESELCAAAEEFDRHALTLTLLGNYLRLAHGSEIRKRHEVDLGKADERQGGQAFRVIAAYTRWLGEGRELSILRLLGFFDRPADAASVSALRAAPPILELTEDLVGLAEEDWQFAVSGLRDHGLLAKPESTRPGSLDAHPLVRVYFAEALQSQWAEAWREGNLRLYEHLQKAAPPLPETLEEMEALYSAIIHGCRAGRQQEALDEILWKRIRRGSKHFSLHQLGAFGSELTALAGFFERTWDRPASSLSPTSQGSVLSNAGFCLRALGRLHEAVQPMQSSLEKRIKDEDWVNAARGAGNLSELTLTLGEVAHARTYAEQSVELADRSGDDFQRSSKRTTLATTLHQMGKTGESAAAFAEAETMQVRSRPGTSLLSSLAGYHYCDLLLDRAEPEGGAQLACLSTDSEAALRLRQVCQEVMKRTKQTLEIAESNHWLLDIAADHLSLGRAHLGLGLTAPQEDMDSELALAAEHLHKSVDGLRQAGEDDVPLGLLARAALCRTQSDFAGATVDLAEALEIAERGSMRLHECDAHLEWTRLDLQRSDVESARTHLARARKLVDDTGYGRREREVAYLERRLAAMPAATRPAGATAGREAPRQGGTQSEKPPAAASGAGGTVPRTEQLPEKAPAGTSPSVFMSYSHVDEAWKDRVVKQLKVLEMEGVLDVWDDRRISAGDDWLPDIEAAMERARVAILLISADFLISKFIRGTEVPRLLERRRSAGLLVIPVIVYPCPWQEVTWLAPIQCRPKDGRPLSRGRKYQIDKNLADLALEISDLLRSAAPAVSPS